MIYVCLSRNEHVVRATDQNQIAMLPHDTDGEGSRYKKVTKKCRNLPRQRALESSSKWVWAWRRRNYARQREKNSLVEWQEAVWNMTQKAGQRAGGRGRQEMRTERQWVMQMHTGSQQKRSYWFKKLFHNPHKYLHSVFNSAV